MKVFKQKRTVQVQSSHSQGHVQILLYKDNGGEAASDSLFNDLCCHLGCFLLGLHHLFLLDHLFHRLDEVFLFRR